MPEIYEEKEHFHLEYSEDNADVEAVALKVKGKQKWDVFFNFDAHNLKIPNSLRSEGTTLGRLVFSANSEKGARKKFIEFASYKIIPLLKRNKRKKK